MPRNTKELSPASRDLREQFLISLSEFMGGGFARVERRSPKAASVVRSFVQVFNPEDLPGYVHYFLPPAQHPALYCLELRDRRPDSLKPTSLSFVGRLAICRYTSFAGAIEPGEAWALTYHINSLHRRIWPGVVTGTEQSNLSAPRAPLPLPDGLPELPQRFSVLEATQLHEFFDSAPTSSGGGSSGN